MYWAKYSHQGPGHVCGGRGDHYGTCGEGLSCSDCNRCPSLLLPPVSVDANMRRPGAPAAHSPASAASTTETASLLLTGGFEHLGWHFAFLLQPTTTPWPMKDNCHLHPPGTKVDCHLAELPETAKRRILKQRLVVSIIQPTLPLKTVQISIKQKYLFSYSPL